MRPRCRWRIGLGNELEPGLVPYRLLVSLIENRRVNGKVHQEHIADLGAIDGHLLASFYNGIDPAIAAKVQYGGAWTYTSMIERDFFWQGVDQTLARLDNRIDATGREQIRAAINARIPRLTTDEREAIPQWEKSQKVKHWHFLRDQFANLVTSTEEEIAYYQRRIENKRNSLVNLQLGTDGLTELVKAVEHEGPDEYEEARNRINSFNAW